MAHYINERDFYKEVSRIKQIRSEPDYVPEFPPSRLIDDSPEGVVRAAYKLDILKKEDKNV